MSVLDTVTLESKSYREVKICRGGDLQEKFHLKWLETSVSERRSTETN